MSCIAGNSFRRELLKEKSIIQTVKWNNVKIFIFFLWENLLLGFFKSVVSGNCEFETERNLNRKWRIRVQGALLFHDFQNENLQLFVFIQCFKTPGFKNHPHYCYKRRKIQNMTGSNLFLHTLSCKKFKDILFFSPTQTTSSLLIIAVVLWPSWLDLENRVCFVNDWGLL